MNGAFAGLLACVLACFLARSPTRSRLVSHLLYKLEFLCVSSGGENNHLIVCDCRYVSTVSHVVATNAAVGKKTKKNDKGQKQEGSKKARRYGIIQSLRVSAHIPIKKTISFPIRAPARNKDIPAHSPTAGCPGRV